LDELTKAVDAYVANHFCEKPRAGALGVIDTVGPRPNYKLKTSPTQVPSQKSNALEQLPDGWHNSKFYTGCFKCGSKMHRKSECPEVVMTKPGTGSSGKLKPQIRPSQPFTSHKANRCTVEPRVFTNSALQADSTSVEYGVYVSVSVIPS